MRMLLFILIYIFLGITFAAWTKAKDRMPESFSGDRDDERLWVFLCVLFWPFIVIGYTVMAIFDKTTETFGGGDDDDEYDK